MLKFSPANAKTYKLYSIKSLQPYIAKGKKIYSFDLLAGHSCPSAKECLSKAVEQKNGSLRIKDGKHTLFRCFSASNEVQYKNVYKLRKHNLDRIRSISQKGLTAVKRLLEANIPKDAGILRWHVSGDYMNKNYFLGFLRFVESRPDILFYAYTKQLKFWVDYKDKIESLPNLCLTASYGGIHDNLIVKHNLRSAKVVYSQYEARKLKLPLDHNDSHAARPDIKNKSFALLIHGTGPKNTKHSKAWARIKKSVGGYSR
jgi:hypothetical protein